MIVVQLVLSKRPESFNAIDVILALVRKGLGMIETMILAPALQRVVTPEGVGVIDRAFPCFLADDLEQCLGRDIGNDRGVHPPVALQEPENNAFPRRASTPLSFPSAAEVRFINFDLPLESGAFDLAKMK